MGHRAAIYCRVSTADQSCERQEFDLRAFAGCAGYDVVGIFKETGSGTKLDRAERKKVLALAQSRQIDAILVTELSRWGRSTLDLLNTLRELENWKVSVIAMNGMAFDLSSPYGRMLATFLSGIAEFERDLRHCCKVSDEAAFCLIQRPYISKTLLTRRISPRGSP
uniref:recombinase family protein n=1 Tax=Enterobacter cloacae TaxID=550 RepID=UPI0020B81196|nr:recombinase family protein [Enterobacter cloacae]